jgi:membrane associated rhomboid family serine protease
MQNRLTISNLLIIISIIFTFIWLYIEPKAYIYSINNYFFNKWDYTIYFLQFFSGTFLHGSLLHLLFNSVFIYFFWNTVEYLIWKKIYIIFFILSCIIIWLTLTIFTNTNTIWISWFAMALLTYYTLELKSRKNPEYKWWITAILINIWIWLHPQISLLWHLIWTIVWFIFYIINKDFFSKEKINYLKQKTNFIQNEASNTSFLKKD